MDFPRIYGAERESEGRNHHRRLGTFEVVQSPGANRRAPSHHEFIRTPHEIQSSRYTAGTTTTNKTTTVRRRGGGGGGNAARHSRTLFDTARPSTRVSEMFDVLFIICLYHHLLNLFLPRSCLLRWFRDGGPSGREIRIHQAVSR